MDEDRERYGIWMETEPRLSRLDRLVSSALNYARGYAWHPETRWRCCGQLVRASHSPACVMWNHGHA